MNELEPALLVLETTAAGNEVHLQASAQGLRHLASVLERIADDADAGRSLTGHFLSDALGGYELSSKAKTDGSCAVQQLVIRGIPTP